MPSVIFSARKSSAIQTQTFAAKQAFGGSSSLQAAEMTQTGVPASAAGTSATYYPLPRQVLALALQPLLTVLTATARRNRSFSAVSKALIAGAAMTLLLCLPSFAGAAQQPAIAPIPAGQANTITLDQYRVRLQQLQQLVAGCQQAMSPALCESDKVGPDVTLSLPDGPREIRFGWLRTLLDQVAHPDAIREETKPTSSPPASPPRTSSKAVPEKPPAAAPRQPLSDRNPPLPSPEDVIGISTTPNIFKRLDSARKRLEQDDRWAEQAQSNTSTAQNPAPSQALQSLASQSHHRTLANILAAKEYHGATAGPTIKDRILEKIANWIDTVLGELIKAGSKSKWIGLTAEIGFIALLCIALVWLLICLERQGRFGSPSIGPGPGANAASARDWQLWLADARQSADRSEWRDAIHYLYWGSISRLESTGLWPADRARTPREYIALLSSESTRHSELIALTRSLERTWYAGRPADESDYHRAEQLAASLAADLSHKTRKGASSR